MKTNIIRWEKSMANRCLARCKDGYTHIAVFPQGLKSHKAVTAKASPVNVTPEKVAPEDALSVDIPAGEWDGFEYAINSVLKKKH